MNQTPPERTNITAPPTVDEWQAAVDAAQAAGAGHTNGATVRELAKHFGSSETTIRRALRLMVDAGTAVCLRGRRSISITGQEIKVPSYIFITKQEKITRGKSKKNNAARGRRNLNRRRP